ncbi:CD59 glycoprotein-like [Polypterus senegalus]|uniref:CD59 glycoprotein-like n=1 Tax=Polypterus senegalus TaxID=55291 RepID=UPI00196402D9|nr:CD59 glycoprotein-like [Polypterus senegalus]
MKTVVLALALALVLAYGDCLKCHYCVVTSKFGSCRPTVQTCGYKEDACVNMVFLPPGYGYARRCIKSSDCFILENGAPNSIKARCCYTDLCN